ncbi:MAG: hypothetical protein ACYCU8_15130 [Ferrimicrobium acidiphilum]
MARRPVVTIGGPSLVVAESADNLVHVGCIVTSLGEAAYCTKARIAGPSQDSKFCL